MKTVRSRWYPTPVIVDVAQQHSCECGFVVNEIARRLCVAADTDHEFFDYKFQIDNVSLRVEQTVELWKALCNPVFAAQVLNTPLVTPL